MPLIQPSSLPLIEAARAGTGTVARADAAARELRADYERWSRLGWGALAYLGTVASIVVGAAALSARADAPWSTAPESFGFGLLGSVSFGVAFLCGYLLYRLWQSGRRLARAAAWWLRLPYARAARTRRASGWLAPRYVQYEPRIFARTMACSLLFLIGACGIGAAFMPGIAQTPHLLGAALAVGVVSLVCLCGVMGGVMRITSGLAEQDPVWTSIRGG